MRTYPWQDCWRVDGRGALRSAVRLACRQDLVIPSDRSEFLAAMLPLDRQIRGLAVGEGDRWE